MPVDLCGRVCVYGGVGRAIHPLDELQQTIAALVADVALPVGRPMDVLNAFRTYSTAESVDFGNTPMTPYSAPAGLTIHRTAKGTKDAPAIYGNERGAPYNGTIVTIKGQEDTALQISIPLVDSNGVPGGGTYARGISMRAGFGDEWSDWLGAWSQLSGYGANGWSVDAAAYAQTSIEGRVFLNGLINKGSASAADGTVIMILPDSLRPRFDEVFLVGGDQFGGPAQPTIARLRIESSGNVILYNFNGGAYLALGGLSYKAANWAAIPGAN